ncbi:MAG: hypothetical protein WCT10_00585 [Patescibacteria group bacterium]|jgi:hypothetical protein
MGLGENRELLRPAPGVEKQPGQAIAHEQEPSREKERVERVDAAVAAQNEAQPASVPAVPAKSAAAPVAAKDTYHIRVERVLEENLVEVYLAMPPAARARFKAEGEATALRLRSLIEQTKIRAKDVLKLILQWLKMIPGVNRYFLEQEAKIKTDKILLLAQEHQKEKEVSAT